MLTASSIWICSLSSFTLFVASLPPAPRISEKVWEPLKIKQKSNSLAKIFFTHFLPEFLVRNHDDVLERRDIAGVYLPNHRISSKFHTAQKKKNITSPGVADGISGAISDSME